MKKIIRWLDINFEAFFGMIVFFAMLGIILCQIFGRNFFGRGFPWGEEICRFCYVWVSYIGLSYATRNSIHIEIDAVRRRFPEKIQKIVILFTQIVMLVLFAFFFYGTLVNAIRIAARGSRALSVDISQNWMYMAGPVGYGLGAFRCIQTLIWKIRHFHCSMPVFQNPYSVLDGGLYNYSYNDELREEYRAMVPEEAYLEEAEFRRKHDRKKGGDTA